MMKPDILLEAKLQHPRPVRDHVERTALMEKIRKSRERLLVFHANMGFGKTMLMSEYAVQSGCRFLWYHLDRQDNDISVFFKYLREGIRQSFSMGQETAADQILNGQTAAAVLNRLVNTGNGSFLIMLDDFQEIENEEIYELLDVILKNTAGQVRMLITTKGTLPRFVNRYVLEGMAAVFKSDELAFSREETFRLLSSGRRGILDPDVAEAIYKYTEGWPAGVMFLHLYQKQGRITVSRDQMLKICQEYLVHDYIMYELFRKLPFDLQEFLKKTSVLEYLDSHICNEVAQIKNAAGQLRYLVQENMFVQKTGGNFEVYRYHSMFRDFLKSQLTEEEQAKLCERAAACYLGSGNPQQALEYALMANSGTMVEAVLQRSGFRLLEERMYFLLSEALIWCQTHGAAVSDYNRILEIFLKLYTEGDPARVETQILERIRDQENCRDDRRLYEKLVTMSVEFYCEKEMDGAADRILAAALDQKRIAPVKWFEYLAARIFLQIRLGRIHHARSLYRKMAAKETGMMVLTDRERKQIRQIRKISLEFVELWTEFAGTEDAEREENWWLSERERLLLAQIRGCRSMCCGKDGHAPASKMEEAAGTEFVDEDSGKAGKKPPEWMTAVFEVYRGMRMFGQGDKVQGCKLAASGAAELRKYPWLVWPLNRTAKRNCSWLCMLEEKGASQDPFCHLYVNCFGKFRMTVMESEEDIHFRTNKAKECMAYLYFMNQPVSREQIIAALWNDVDELPSNEVAALHNIFSTLRKSLSPYGLEDLIRYEDKKYFLKNGILFSDMDRIKSFLHAADAGDQDGILQESWICELYEGPYFQDIGGIWCINDRAYFDKKLSNAFAALAQIYKKEQDYENCLRILNRAEEINPVRESVNLSVMDCLIQLRDGSMLKHYYQKLEKDYLEITGDVPGEAVRNRYQDGMKICGK